MSSVKRKKKPSVTIFTPFSGRFSCIYQFMKGLTALDKSLFSPSLLFYDNSNDVDFGDILRSYQNKYRKEYRSVRIYQDDSVPFAGKGDLKELAVARILEIAKPYVNTDYFFILEDDTVCPSDALKKLGLIMFRHPKVGAAQGVEVGRHDAFTIGAARVDELFHFPPQPGMPQPVLSFKGYISLSDIPNSGIMEIGGGGFYTTLFRTPLYKRIKFDERYLPMIAGTDIAAGPKMRRLGYKWVLDGSIRCTHYSVDKYDLRTYPLTCEVKEEVTNWERKK